jgi:murein DD-endopeptidase MepM/ murein hydrolase activator NlpD
MRCALVIAMMLATSPKAEALSVRFFPANTLYTYELNGARRVSSLLCHGIAVVNDGNAAATVSEVHIELLVEGRVLDVRTLASPELRNYATRGAALQAAGQLERMSFVFGGETLLPRGTRLARTPTLAPGEALMITSQVFAFTGARDQLRVRAIAGRVRGEAAVRVSSERSRTAFVFPLRGEWYDGAAPSFHSHHRWVPSEQFAHDLVQIGPTTDTHRGDGLRFRDYYAYGEPVSAAASGVVVAAVDTEGEDPRAMRQRGEAMDAYLARLQADQAARLARGALGLVGNHVVIDHGNGEFSLYAHLKPGSVRVEAGARIEQGARIGDVGSTGNSTEPHLHFQVCDGPDPLLCSGIPPRWQNLAMGGVAATSAPQTGHILSALPP